MNERSIFMQVLDLGGPAEEARYLDQVCGDDTQLRQRVEELLRAHRMDGRFVLDQGVADLGLTLDLPPLTEGPGTVIGPYKLREQIGEGGMGVVYVAEQSQPVRRRVALKIIKPGMDTKHVIARFEAERQALAMMDHPNISRVFDGGTTESGRPYFVMELVKGIPITEYCDANHLSLDERLDLFALVCQAVQHAHLKGIIHRDIKPSNVLITLHDGVPVPKVIDFGIAKATHGERLTEKTIYTRFAELIGTPLYMSPEQASMSALDVDTRSDIYSLGVLLYELLTGTTPFDAEKLRTAALAEVQRIIREDEPPRPSTRLSTLGATLTTVSASRQCDPKTLSRSLHGELDWIVMKALEKDRQRRYETASAFAADVRNYLSGQAVTACPPSAWYRFRKYARRHRAALTTAAVVGLALVMGTAVATWQAIRATRAVALAARREREAQSAAASATRASALAARREREAKEAADESKAVLQFLVQDMLGASEPEKGLGRDVTVAEVLSNTEKKIDTAFPNQPLVEAGVRQALASAYLSLAQFGSARRHGLRSYELRRDLLGPDDPETLTSMFDLATALWRLHQNDKAHKLCDEVLERRRRVLGPEHRDTLSSMNLLANVLGAQGKKDKALELYEQTLELRRRFLGPERLDTLQSMNNLAIALQERGKVDEACKLYEQALEMGRQIGRAEHPSTLYPMRNLAYLLKDQGKTDEARKLLEEALKIERRVLGPTHPYTLRSLKTLAEQLKRQGREDEAQKLLDERLKRLEQEVKDNRLTLGPEHTSTLGSMRSLASALQETGRIDEARELWEQALKIERRVLGPTHIVTVDSLEILADMFKVQGKEAAAQEALDERRRGLKQALEDNRRSLGPEHADTLWAMRSLAGTLKDLGRTDEARKLYEQALEIERRQGFESYAWNSMVRLVELLLIDPNPSAVDRNRALELARQMTRLRENDELPWRWLGLAEYRNENWHAAITAETRSIQIRGNDGDIDHLLCLAMAHARLGDREAARRWYNRIKVRFVIAGVKSPDWNPPSPKWLVDEAKALLGEIQVITERAQLAEFLRQGLESDPNHAAWWFALALFEYNSGRWDEAIEAIGKWRECELERVVAEGLGEALMAASHAHRNDLEAARVWYERALRIRDRNAPTAPAHRREFYRFLADAETILDRKAPREEVTPTKAEPPGPSK